MKSTAVLNYMVHHVFLPPQLPQADDFRPQHDTALIETMLKALSNLEPLVDDSTTVTALQMSSVALRRLKDTFNVDAAGAIHQLRLRDLLQEVSVTGELALS